MFPEDAFSITYYTQKKKIKKKKTTSNMQTQSEGNYNFDF